MSDRLRTVVLGFGRIAAGYSQDPRMTRWFQFATHAQVLTAHKGFNWTSVVDPDPAAQSNARQTWGVTEVVSHISRLANRELFEVAVLATPPDQRLGVLDHLPNLKGVIVEKPLGSNLNEASAFLSACAARNILVQVNFPRRGDRVIRSLTASLSEDIGKVQAAFALYGNGLTNNGSHIIDLTRMLLGEIEWVCATAVGTVIREGPIPDDISIPFVLGMDSGFCLMAQPLSFRNYRENGLDIWGERGRLSFWQEGLVTCFSPQAEHRFLDGHFEIASDSAHVGLTGQGDAMFELYDNLLKCVKSAERLWSPGESALKVMKIVSAIQRSFAEGGRRIGV